MWKLVPATTSTARLAGMTPSWTLGCELARAMLSTCSAMTAVDPTRSRSEPSVWIRMFSRPGSARSRCDGCSEPVERLRVGERAREWPICGEGADLEVVAPSRVRRRDAVLRGRPEAVAPVEVGFAQQRDQRLAQRVG